MNQEILNKLQELIKTDHTEHGQFEAVLRMLGGSDELLAHGNLFPGTYDNPMTGTMWVLWQCRSAIEQLNKMDRLIVGSDKIKN